jgi:hypothetical protein
MGLLRADDLRGDVSDGFVRAGSADAGDAFLPWDPEAILLGLVAWKLVLGTFPR